MLDKKKNYKGCKVVVFNTGLKTIDNKEFKIIGQYPSDKDGLLFELSVLNPNSKKIEPLCIKESQCKIL